MDLAGRRLGVGGRTLGIATASARGLGGTPMGSGAAWLAPRSRLLALKPSCSAATRSARVVNKGFVIAGADGNFTRASARIAGKKVIVESPSGAAPTAVRYGWSSTPDVNLFNKEGLPATPFRTDW
jgi:hypothetical protein